MGTCPSHQPGLCSTLHRCCRQLRRRSWPTCLLSPGLQDRSVTRSGMPLKKAGLSTVL